MTLNFADIFNFIKSSLSSSLSAAGLTDKGMERENNEDVFYIDREKGIFIVSDGVGGEQAGEVVSRMVVDYLPSYITSSSDSLSPESILETSIIDVSNYIRDYTKVREEMRGAGATVVVCLIENDKATIGHMGDSRAYLLRDNNFKQLTEDHSVVFALIKAGVITRDEAKKSSIRNRITSCIGMEEEPLVSIQTVDLLPGDKLLLCSDGLTDMLSDEIIGQILLSEEDLQIACRKLIDMANSAGGRDNITSVIIQYGHKKRLDEEKIKVIPFNFHNSSVGSPDRHEKKSMN